VLRVIDNPLGSRPGLGRRAWLQLGGLGLLGLSLPRLLRAEPTAGAPARSCVLFLLHGGPSQLDTWDLKPEAPAEVRGEFRPIATTVPALRIVEHLPRLARLAHRFTVVRSMTHASLFHNSATYLVTTGQPPPRDLIAFTPTENDFPHLGAQVALKRPGGLDLPAAVSLPDPVSDGPYTTPGQNAGFLGAAYAPFRIDGDPNEDGFVVDGLDAGPEVREGRLAPRRSLLRAVNEQLGRLGDDRRVEQLDGYQQRAYSLLTSDAARRASSRLWPYLCRP
jgi:hypothetical protein